MGQRDCQKKVEIMYHFFVKNEDVSDDKIFVRGEDVNHIKNVLRMKIGEEIIISDENGRDYNCELAGYDRDVALLKVRFIYEMGHELPCKIYLFQGLPKNDKMELIIQKAVELGAYSIIPVAMKRCVVKLDEKKADIKKARWQSISESAAKQSKRSIIPNISKVLSFEEAMESAGKMDVILLPYENARGMEYTRKVLDNIKNGESVAVFIGPEGGFDEEEISLARKFDAKILSLGKRILRTETAGMTMLSMLVYNLEE